MHAWSKFKHCPSRNFPDVLGHICWNPVAHPYTRLFKDRVLNIRNNDPIHEYHNCMFRGGNVSHTILRCLSGKIFENRCKPFPPWNTVYLFSRVVGNPLRYDCDSFYCPVYPHLQGKLYMYILTDTIDKWDEDKLKEVVEKKHAVKVKPKTDIVSTVHTHPHTPTHTQWHTHTHTYTHTHTQWHTHTHTYTHTHSDTHTHTHTHTNTHKHTQIHT